MLLNITVENFRSYDEAQTLSLIASENNGVNSVAVGDIQVRKSAIIYGANASGKSNLIKVGTWILTLLQKDLNPNLYQPFFDSKEPTKFSIDFEYENQIFTYKLDFDAQKFHYEALFDNEDQIIFERKYTDNGYEYATPGYEYLLNKEQLTVQEEIIKAWRFTTTEKQLFLRRAAENGSENLKQLVQSIAGVVIRANPYMSNGEAYLSGNDLIFASNFYQSRSNQPDLIRTLNAIGAGFTSLEIIDKDITMPDGKVSKARSINSHYLRNGNDVVMNFANESDGTIKFYNYFALINHIVDIGGVIIIDELETHFHPLLVEEIIKAVHNSTSKAQLIFSTHNPILLNDSIFERDQIYFASKNANQATELYSLADFTDLKELDNLQAKYMTGKFGAIPYLHSLDFGGNK